jgi:hypothetical protein
VSFSITNNIATIVITPTAGIPDNGVFPVNGYNGPNQAIAGYPNAPANGQQVTLWGFTTATYFNGLQVTVISNNPAANSFSFAFTHANVGSTADAGSTASAPIQRYRAVRLECSQTIGTDFIYVGDFAVSSIRYVAALSLAGQLSVEIAGENIPPERVWIAGTNSTDSCQVSLIY